jgi:probable rRNA maturation factor
LPSPQLRKPPIAVDILVEAGDWPPESELDAIVSRILAAAVKDTRPALAKGSELSLVFTDDASIRALNQRFRDMNKPTNVLSFPGVPAGTGFGPLLGDIVLARETVYREAEAGGLTIEAHLAHLILHGFLHILGYDHEDEAEATAMERLETAILGGLGIADPYAGPP